MYNDNCCDMIAMKREVAALTQAGFPWSECQVKKTGDKSLYHLFYNLRLRNKCKGKQRRSVCYNLGYTRRSGTGTACRTKIYVRKGGGFFYGKSSNENHTEGV